MFSPEYKEYSQKEIELKEIDATALEQLINYAYSGSIRIDTNNCQSIMIGASFLQLTTVRNACAEFLMRKFHPQNVLGIKSFADSLSHSTLVLAADKFINRKFAAIASSEEFMQLPFNELIDIVRRDEICGSEEVIFEACMRWIKYNESERSQHLPEVLSKVRLPLLSPQFLADSVATEELIRSSHTCRDLLDEAKDYHLMPERRELLQSYRTRPRGNEFLRGEIYAVGGLTKSGDAVSTVEIYNVQKNEWRMGEAMSMLRSRVGVAVLHNKLYAFGGFNGQERLSTVEIFDPETKTWTQGKTMMCKRSAVGVASLDDFIYVSFCAIGVFWEISQMWVFAGLRRLRWHHVTVDC
jgi:kelch-like protein 18